MTNLKRKNTADQAFDYEIAMAAGCDAANRQMRCERRTEWNEDDFNLAAKVATSLMAAPL